MSRDKLLHVSLNGCLLGRLEQNQVGKMVFSYAKDAKRSLSMSMPLRPDAYDDDACEAYFGGLLPESETARKAIARHYGANANNTFSLLRAIGHDCAGALSLDTFGETVLADAVAVAGRILTDTELATHLRDLPKRPLMIGVDDMRLSLAGAQDKASLCLIGGQLAVPAPGTPTTHILKPRIADVGETVTNEYLCMRLAAAIGLPVAAVEIGQAEDVPYLLVERYDRVTADGLVRRLHQEDFCQAVGIRSTQKYESDGGPNLLKCFELTKRLAAPARARIELLDLVIFNVLIGNGDAHAKNYAVLHPPGSKPILAPAYDLLSTRYYFGRRSKMAMKVGGHREFERVYLRHWQRFSQEVALGFPLVRTTLVNLEARLQGAITAERAHHDTEEAQRVLDYVSCHARAMAQQAQAGPSQTPPDL